jgi:hypothetical protein
LTNGLGSTGTITFTVTRSGNTGDAVTVNYMTQDNSAVAPIDYTAIPLTPLTFGPGVTTQTIPVSVKLSEPEERYKTFNVVLSNLPSSFMIGGSSFPFAACNRQIGAAEGDLNGDGKPDLVLSCQTGPTTVAVLLNTTPPGATTPTFSSAFLLGTSGSNSVAIADINGDGIPDIVASGSSTSVFLNNTTPGATTPVFAGPFTVAGISAEDISQSLAVGDLNGDGMPDIATADSSNNVNIALNTTPKNGTTASFSGPVAVPTGNSFGYGTFSLKIGDLNGDGKPDIAVASFGNFGSVGAPGGPAGERRHYSAFEHHHRGSRDPNILLAGQLSAQPQ